MPATMPVIMPATTFATQVEQSDPNLSVEIPAIDDNGHPMVSFIDLATGDHYWATFIGS